MIDPQEDGTKHLNVTYNSKTQLGRMLSPPYPATFTLSDHGDFQSVAGYWLWLVSGRKDQFREASGEKCLTDSKFPSVQQKVDTDQFQSKILKATWVKIRENDNIFSRFQQNILPFRRYYIGEGRIYKPSDSEWFCDGLDEMTEYIEKTFW